MQMDDGLRTDGGLSNPNHLLGAFPVLFPYGLGGFKTSRRINIPYEVHAQWALQYGDRKFRKDVHFIFSGFWCHSKTKYLSFHCLTNVKQLF